MARKAWFEVSGCEPCPCRLWKKKPCGGPECPGGPFIGMADAGSCFHGGADIHVDFDDEDIEEFFGDNVLMKEWKYYKEGCHKPAQCEFIDPDVNHHQFPVGKSVVRVEGIDIAGNMNKCHRTVYILDKQVPKFVVPSKEVDPEGFFRIKMGSDNLAIEEDCTWGVPSF